jgi:hypothetical protein
VQRTSIIVTEYGQSETEVQRTEIFFSQTASS